MTVPLLLMHPLPGAIEAALDARFAVHRVWQADDPEAFLRRVGPTIRAYIAGGHMGISPRMLDSLPALEIVSVFGVGLDKVDLEDARRRGVRVSHTPNVLTDDVADLAIGLTIAALRGIGAGERLIRAGRWAAGGGLPLARKVSDCRFGIFGLGRIGTAIARRLAGFGVEISYHDLIRRPDLPYRAVDSLMELARGCDVLVISASASAETAGIVGPAVLEELGPAGFLINVARGSIVDEPALIEALEAGTIQGAGLDVFADEPNAPASLFGRDDVVLTPHIASGTAETRQAMGELVLANLDAHFAGRPLPTAAA